LNAIAKLDSPVENANFRNYVMEIAWFGLATAATSRFFSVYAIRVGATPIELGWMTSLPFIVLLISTTLSSWWRSRYTHTMKSYFWPSVGFRTSFLLPALTPLFPLRWQPVWLILSVIIPALPQGVSSNIFTGMMRDSIYTERQTTLASKRTLWMSITVGIGVLIFGFWLENAPFPLNYQVMFLLAFALALISHAYVMRVNVPQPPAPVQVQVISSQAAPMRSPNFQRMVLVVVIAHLGFFALLPVIPLHMVKNLGADEGFMAIFGTAEIVASAIICLFTDRIIKYFGTRKTIAGTLAATGAAALVMATTRNLSITLAAGAIAGAAWTTTSVAMYGHFVEATKDIPTHDMTRYTTVYQQLVYIAAFIGPMVGSNLANAGVNLLIVMVVGATMRVVAGVVIFNLDTLLYVPARRLRRIFYGAKIN
jgi:MFS family permease